MEGLYEEIVASVKEIIIILMMFSTLFIVICNKSHSV